MWKIIPFCNLGNEIKFVPFCCRSSRDFPPKNKSYPLRAQRPQNRVWREVKVRLFGFCWHEESNWFLELPGSFFSACVTEFLKVEVGGYEGAQLKVFVWIAECVTALLYMVGWLRSEPHSPLNAGEWDGLTLPLQKCDHNYAPSPSQLTFDTVALTNYQAHCFAGCTFARAL